MREVLDRRDDLAVLERHTELIVGFGGIPIKNTLGEPRAAPPGTRRATTCARRAARGAEFVLLSPLRDDLPGRVGADVATRSCPAPTPR